MKLSLIVPYRQRKLHLKTQIAWWKTKIDSHLLSECEVIIVEAARQPSTWIQNEIAETNMKYIYLHCPGVFHKTKALNLGLANSQGDFIVPFDVDWIPINNTLEKHLQIAERSPSLLVSGYRVMCADESIEIDNMMTVIQQSTIAAEDQPTALRKHLITSEKFGIAPFFERRSLIAINGWDENFIGWGAEDQDIIERYLNNGYYFCRSPELVYLHLNHGTSLGWNEDLLINKNRQYYYAKMQARQGSISPL